MNKFLIIIVAFFLNGTLIAQSTIQIDSPCEDVSECLPADECSVSLYPISISASTDCSVSSNLDYQYQVDLFQNNLFEITGNESSFEAYLPKGIHKIVFTISDSCNTTETCEFLFEVRDCEPPTPGCILGIATFVIQSDSGVTIDISDLMGIIVGSDNCTPTDELVYSFSEDINDVSLAIPCTQVPIDGLIPFTVYTFDEDGNFDFCSNFIAIQDPGGICQDSIFLQSYVATHNPCGDFLENVNYSINSDIIFTDHFPISNLSIGDTITPSSNQNILDGVTTFDLILISKHILQGGTLNENWQLLAADANEDGMVTALDVAILRALILKEIIQLPSGKSRIFEPSFVVFDGSFSSFQFQSSKLGDVNENQSNCIEGNSFELNGSSNFIDFKTPDKEFKTDDLVIVPIYSDEFVNLAGIQLSIGFNTTQLEFLNIIGNSELGISEENFGYSRVDNGEVSISWNDIEGVDLPSDEPFIILSFKAKNDGILSDLIRFQSTIIPRKVFKQISGVVYSSLIPSLKFEEVDEAGSFSIFPNPFAEKITFKFDLAMEEFVELEIYDATGRQIISDKYFLIAGENQIEIKRERLLSTGVYYYQLKTLNNTWNGKIIAD